VFLTAAHLPHSLITISPIGSRPTKAVIRRYTKHGLVGYDHDEDEELDMDFPNFGLYFEADAVARSLRDGELENKSMPHAETALTMKVSRAGTFMGKDLTSLCCRTDFRHC